MAPSCVGHCRHTKVIHIGLIGDFEMMALGLRVAWGKAATLGTSMWYSCLWICDDEFGSPSSVGYAQVSCGLGTKLTPSIRFVFILTIWDDGFGTPSCVG